MGCSLEGCSRMSCNLTGVRYHGSPIAEGAYPEGAERLPPCTRDARVRLERRKRARGARAAGHGPVHARKRAGAQGRSARAVPAPLAPALRTRGEGERG